MLFFGLAGLLFHQEIILQSVGIPGEGIGIILGVDRVLDMSRTVLNVTGDITAAVYVANSEGRLPKTASVRRKA